MTRVALVWIGLLAVAGCTRTQYVNKAYRQRLSTPADKLLILPVEAHGFPDGLRPLLEKLVCEELGNAFAGRGLSMINLRGRFAEAGFGNLSWQLAQGMYHRAAEHRSPEMKGSYPDWLDELPLKARRFLKWAGKALSAAGAGVPPGMRFRYLLAGYADRIQILGGGKRIRFRVIAGIFDGREGRTVAVAWDEPTVQADRTAVRQAVTAFGQRIRQALAPVLQ